MIYKIFWWYAVISAYPVQLLFFKRKTYYEDENAKKNMKKYKKSKNGALIISNHYSFFDYPLTMFAVLPRKLNIVCSEIPYKSKLLTIGMRFFGGIQANRITKDLSFINKSVDVIKDGGLVQIFPEGRNTDDGTIKPFKHSYIVIAHRANAPIIPIVTDGSYGFFKRSHIIIGNEIRVSDYIEGDLSTPTRNDMRNTNDVIYNKMLELKAKLEELSAADNHKSKRKKK